MTKLYEQEATYLGDGAYIKFDGFETTIFTTDGIDVTNAVVIEPNAIAVLQKFLADVQEAFNDHRLIMSDGVEKS